MRKIDRALVAREIVVPGPKDDKYSRGVVLAATGSLTYPGAALLSVRGATAAGAGFVRYVGPERCENLILPALPEVVLEGGRFNAAVVGSGWDSSMMSYVEALARQCAADSIPMIVDAGALPGVKEWARSNPLVVATPHVGEASRMFQQFGEERPREEISADVASAARDLADLCRCVVVIKGHETGVASPGGEPYLFSASAAWGATAGAGDVLAGVIAAFVAGRAARLGDLPNEPVLELTQAAAGAVGLHGLAAGVASAVLTADLQPNDSIGRPIVASDIAAAIPNTIERLW